MRTKTTSVMRTKWWMRTKCKKKIRIKANNGYILQKLLPLSPSSLLSLSSSVSLVETTSD